MSGGRFKGAPDLCLGREPVRVTSPGKLLRGIRHVMGRRSPVLFGQATMRPSATAGTVFRVASARIAAFMAAPPSSVAEKSAP